MQALKTMPKNLATNQSGSLVSSIVYIVVGAALMYAPSVMYPVFLMKVLCFAVAASAVNLLLGYTGLLSFGHAMFFGFSAYIGGHFAKAYGVTPEVAILMGTLSSMILGFVVGVIAIRRQGIYFAMVTLALAQIVFFYCLQAPFTGGEDGMQNIPRGLAFGLWDISTDYSAYFFVLLVCGSCLALIARLIRSPYGQVLTAIRDNEPRAISLGYNVNAYKLGAFTFSAGVTGLAGATKAIAVQIASLTDVSWHMSGEFVLMTLIGGLGTILGPIFGSGVLLGLETYLAELNDWVLIVKGAVFFIVVLAFRQGIVGTVSPLLSKWLRQK